MPAYIALYRFWPDIAVAVRHATASDAEGRPRTIDPPPLAIAPLEGSFDLAVSFLAPGLDQSAGSLCLRIAEALAAPAAAGRASSQPPAPAGDGQESLFASLPPGVAVHVLRALDGWNMLATPDQPAWLTMSAAFLRRRLYQEYDFRTSSLSQAVNELATLVLGTHHAVDVEGTSETYGLPCIALRGWLDDEQVALEGASSPDNSRSAKLASLLHYAVLLPEPASPGALSSPAAFRVELRERLALAPPGEVRVL